MPGNENNPFNNEVPKMNDNNANNNPISPQNNNQPENKPIIEIPQAYYDKLAQEELEKRENAEKEAREKEERAASASEVNQMMTYVILNAIIIFASMYMTVNKTIYALAAIPIFIVIFSISNASKYKDKSSYPASIMVGGILVAAVTFVISMIKEDQMDLWTYYAIISAVIGFLGLIASTIITKVISDYKSIKAIQGIGYILYFVALVAVPMYLEKNYHEEFYKLLFNTQAEVKAETETEFVLKTLKQRYSTEFTCGTYANSAAENEKKLTVGKYNSKIDQYNHRVTERHCLDKNLNDITVISTAYNEGSVEYIVSDNYIDVLFLYETKTALSRDILNSVGAKEVDISLYPEENCYFYGDCADCDEYYDRYELENSLSNQYKVSTKLNFENELLKKPLEFINSKNFKYIISISAQFGDNTDYSIMIDRVLERLNALGYKNTFGYIISIYNINTNGLETKALVYKVKGNSNSEQIFNNPEVQNISANK